MSRLVPLCRKTQFLANLDEFIVSKNPPAVDVPNEDSPAVIILPNNALYSSFYNAKLISGEKTSEDISNLFEEVKLNDNSIQNYHRVKSSLFESMLEEIR
ncbi:hypothetical protein BHECKSOX_123 [Bathymodiolus heckerae thiotrophic gill symbiont]|uniref:hypothetical protein n=1 Tax=Bathymodiolus heckerae thiotrophic gill symbiont TaxID=1052212 RepID=UPI0010BC6C38|nr:hypothetical protein [Bathymodiolus heckerae thiotrophic gill symbiont]SHN92080.1 hypothetical protein BHECKSOX_123 [Bathymodiolus heckerae thiotrophic gill symbiont]